MPDMIEAKIATLEASMKILKAATNASHKFSDWTFDRRRKNIQKRSALSTARFERKMEKFDKRYEDRPVNYALTEAGRDTISRSLNDTANLFAVDSNGECTSHELTR